MGEWVKVKVFNNGDMMDYFIGDSDEAAIYAESWLKSGMTAVGIEYLEDKADEMCTIDFGD